MKVYGNPYQEVDLAWIHSPLVSWGQSRKFYQDRLMEWPFKVATLVIVTYMCVCDVFVVLSLKYPLSYMHMS